MESVYLVVDLAQIVHTGNCTEKLLSPLFGILKNERAGVLISSRLHNGASFETSRFQSAAGSEEGDGS